MTQFFSRRSDFAFISIVPNSLTRDSRPIEIAWSLDGSNVHTYLLKDAELEMNTFPFTDITNASLREFGYSDIDVLNKMVLLEGRAVLCLDRNETKRLLKSFVPDRDIMLSCVSIELFLKKIGLDMPEIRDIFLEARKLHPPRNRAKDDCYFLISVAKLGIDYVSKR